MDPVKTAKIQDWPLITVSILILGVTEFNFFFLTQEISRELQNVRTKFSSIHHVLRTGLSSRDSALSKMARAHGAYLYSRPGREK